MGRNLNSKKYVVYKHTNKINGKCYIGQTCDVADRWRCNGKNYFNSIKFFNAIKKYGWDGFTHEVLYSDLNKDAADIIEKELIEKYDSINNGYNLKQGGSRGELSVASLKKMGESLKRGYIEHPERRLKISQSKAGKKMAPDPIRARGLRAPQSIIVSINGNSGSIRYWSSAYNIDRHKLKHAYDKYGIDGLKLYILIHIM